MFILIYFNRSQQAFGFLWIFKAWLSVHCKNSKSQICLFCQFLMYSMFHNLHVFFFLWNSFQTEHKINNLQWFTEKIMKFLCILGENTIIKFVHKSRKLAIFEPTWQVKMLRNLQRYARFLRIWVSKDVWYFIAKSHKTVQRDLRILKNYHKNSRAGHDAPPPPPGLFRVKLLFSVCMCFYACFLCFLCPLYHIRLHEGMLVIALLVFDIHVGMRWVEQVSLPLDAGAV